MTLEPSKIDVSVNERDRVSALVYLAPKQIRLGVTLILGHGAGAGQLSGFMRHFASGLAERGLDVVTFNFLYMELGKHVPDPKAKLEACYVAVIDAAGNQKKLQGNRIAVGGKSMGGRIGSQVAATEGSADRITGVVLLGYPLHPPGRPEKMRDAHLPEIHAPILFVQGSRDAFGTKEELQATIKKHRLKATLYDVEGGDHSLKVPKSQGVPQEEVYAAAMDKIVSWLQAK